MKRISSIVFDKHEQLKRAAIITPLGNIKVEWRNVAGDRYWTSSGDLAAKQLAVPVIQRIERLFSDAFNPKPNTTMIANLDPHPVIATRKTPNLILHCGAQNVEMDEVRKVRTPRSTNSWCPIPHHQLISQVQNTLKTTNLRIGTQAHSLSHEGQRYFGLMEIHAQKSSDDYCWVLGLRNSHDKTFPAGIVAGASVFVCDNLSFSGEIKFARKHTRFIVRDLPQLVSRSIGLLLGKWHNQDKRIAAYKEAEISDIEAHDLIIRATDVGVCSNRLIPPVLSEWREPRHDAFDGRNVWSLFNAFTESLKDGNLSELPKRTEALHGLLDTHVGLSA